MYLTFYGLTEKPFSQTPDPKFLYWNDAYRETIASLRYGIQERKGFVTMIGEAGTGKTTLLRKLLDDLGPDVVSVFLFNPNASFEEILEYTLSELGIPAASGRKLAMLQRLNDFLLAAFQEGKNTILLIDEAQDLDTEVLESLRLLSNLETAKEKILQIVLSGQPELATRLAQPNLRQLKQRIAVRCRIEPLGRHELADYIAARLAVAGGRGDLFAPATLDPIWEFARGIPRLINTACDNALLVGYALGRQTIDTEVIGEVIADLGRIDVAFEPVTTPGPVAASPAIAPPIAVPAAQPAAPAAPPPPAAGAQPAASSEPAVPVIDDRRTPDLPASANPTPSQAAPAPEIRPATAPAGPAAAPAPAARPRAAAPREPAARPRRPLAAVLVVMALLALTAAGAWAALRWPEIAPRLQGLIGAGRRVASVDAPVPAVPPAARPAEPPAAAAQHGDDGPAPAAAVAPAASEPHAAEPAVARKVSAASDPGVEAGPAGAPRDRTAEAAAPAPAPQRPEPAVEPVASAPVNVASAPVNVASAPVNVASAREPAHPVAAPSTAESRQDLQPARRPGHGAKKVLVQRGDTLMNLAAREYGNATYTVLDVVRDANPDIHDVDRIIAGSEIVFPDPGASTRVQSGEDGISVLVATTPALGQAQELQRMVGSRYRYPADLEPIALGDGRNLYRVSLRQVPDKQQALQIAESLGSILRDPS